MKLSKKLFMSALLLCTVSGGVMVAVAEEGEVWQQGGLATNQTDSKGTAAAQKALSVVMAGAGIISNGMIFAQRFFPLVFPSIVCSEATIIPVCLPFPFSGADSWYFNFDLVGLALDAVQLNDAHSKKAQWSEDIPELQAQIRNIGSLGSIEAECEEIQKSGGTGGFFCNLVSATLDGTEVHVSTLKNVGLEALEDVAGSILKTPEELIGANYTIATGFGTQTALSQATTTTGTNTNSSTNSNSSILWSNYVTDYGTSMNGASSGSSGSGGASNGSGAANGSGASYSTDPSDQMTEEEKKKADFRRKVHIQMVGTAGVARADLASSLAASEKAQFERLSTYIGSGGGSVVANAKVLVSLDLTLAQRLNLLNMVQGQQVANEAASALQMIE